MDRDRVTPVQRSSRSRKLPSPGATPRSAVDSNSKEPQQTNGGLEKFDEAPTRDVASTHPESPAEKPGVAYISETLIKRITKEENLTQITTLHITLGRDLNKKIKYIENLDNLRKLLQLKLNDHMIEKIEKLDHLTHLRELYLVNNKITKMEGLDCLVHLQVLNLSGNLIEHLPAGVFKKLKEIQAFHVAHNRLASLVEVTKLRPLADLTSFSMEGNPMAQLQHSRQFVIFQLRTLRYLDKKEISEDERQVADEQFAQEEVRRLETEINRQEKDNQSLQEEKVQALSELEQLKRFHSEQKIQSVEDMRKIKELQRELEAKEELLTSKTAELSKACEKQFKLEQELAFYKLDAKFKHLGMMPLPEGVEFGDEEDDESPYIGKAMFKPNKFSRQSNVLSGEQHGSLQSPPGVRPGDKYDKQNQQLQQDIHDALVLDLRDKEAAIQQAEEVLAQLNDQLNRRKTQLQDAGDKLALIKQAIDDQAQLLGEEERKLIEAIAEKKNYIRKLQQVAKELEDRMKRVSDEIAQREDDAEKLRQTVRNTSPDDPAYSHLQTKLAAKEQQLHELRGECGRLQQDYERAQARLQEERAALKNLEDQLRALRRAHGDQDQLREELKNIIDDLTDNLNHMKQQVSQQARQISQLQHEKDALGQRLRDMQEQKTNNKHLKDNVAKMQQQLKLNEDALDRERKNGDKLRRRLSDLETQASRGTALEPALNEVKKRLHEAEAEVARLQNALNKAKQQLQDDRQAADERLRKEQERVDKALQAARNGADKERENKELLAQVGALTANNASLADRLKEAEDELGNVESLLDKEEVLERLAALTDDINRKRDGVRQPISDRDDLGRALADLHQKYLELMRDLDKEHFNGETRNREADGELQDLHDKLLKAENALKQAKDRYSQLAEEKDGRDAQLKKMAAELKKLEDKLGRQERLEDQLKRDKAAHAIELGRLKDQVGMLKDQLRRAQEGVEDELNSARLPLQAKIRELENGVHQLQTKLGKTKAENEKLKATVSAAEAGRGDLEDRLAELMGELKDAWARAEKGDKHAWQRELLESKVKALGDELERARERLNTLRAEAAGKLQAEKEKAAARIGGLEDEIDGLKDRLRKLQDKADHELNRVRDAGARKAQELDDRLANLRGQLQDEKSRREGDLRKARAKEAALQELLGESEAQLQRTAQQSHTQQAQMHNLQQEIDGLRNSLKEAETQAVKEQLDKELEAVRAEQRKVAAQAAAARQLADAEQQVGTMQSLLDVKDRQLQDQIKRGAQNSSDLAAQRGEISNLASALAAQSAELGRLKEDLADISRVHVAPPYFHAPDPSLTALANEVDALRAALMHKEQQVQGLIHSLPGPSYVPTTSPGVAVPKLATQAFLPVMAPGTGGETMSAGGVPGLVTAPGGLVTGTQTSIPGQIVHHHHFSKKGVRGKKKSRSSLPASSAAISPPMAGSTTLTGSPSASVHHHFYEGTAAEQDGDEQESKKRRKRKQEHDVLFCNVPDHDGLEYELGRLEGVLATSMQAQSNQTMLSNDYAETNRSRPRIPVKKRKSQRDSLRMELKDLEHEVEDSLKRRATARQSQQHSLDATLAKFQDHLLTIVDHKSRLSSQS